MVDLHFITTKQKYYIYEQLSYFNLLCYIVVVIVFYILQLIKQRNAIFRDASITETQHTSKKKEEFCLPITFNTITNKQIKEVTLNMFFIRRLSKCFVK